MFSKNVKIVNSSATSNVEIVDNFTMKLHFPYSDKLVTIKINPHITDYKEEIKLPGALIKQAFVYGGTNETQELTFDFQKNNMHKVKISGKDYTIKLLNIGKCNFEGQDYPEFEFFIEEK